MKCFVRKISNSQLGFFSESYVPFPQNGEYANTLDRAVSCHNFRWLDPIYSRGVSRKIQSRRNFRFQTNFSQIIRTQTSPLPFLHTSKKWSLSNSKHRLLILANHHYSVPHPSFATTLKKRPHPLAHGISSSFLTPPPIFSFLVVHANPLSYLWAQNKQSRLAFLLPTSYFHFKLGHILELIGTRLERGTSLTCGKRRIVSLFWGITRPASLKGSLLRSSMK